VALHPSFQTITEQVAAHLREELLRGRWSGEMPGQKQLAKLLGVSGKTVELAFVLLEKDGVLVGQGTGRRRRIALPENFSPPSLRVALLIFDSPDRGADYMIELRHLLEEAGHVPFFPDKTLSDLGSDVGRVARFVKKTQADVWIVSAGSQGVLEWFSAQAKPAFALFGRMVGLPMAGAKPDKATPLASITRQLVGLGHRRISFLCRHQSRLPQPGRAVRAFLDELEPAGVAVGQFNLPGWEERPEGFERVLDSLFGHTPPTALILDEPFLYNAAYHYLARRGILAPEHVSLVCTDASPDFDWCQPTVAHIRWDHRPLVRRIVRWTNNIARGKDDRRQSYTKVEIVEGGTVGPAPGR
jgi:hypothetical protein